jgi:hypothetical protein
MIIFRYRWMNAMVIMLPRMFITEHLERIVFTTGAIREG